MSLSHRSGLVKSCPKLESGLRLGQEGLHACQLGPFSSPIFWTAEELANLQVTREMIAEKRRWIFELLNDDHSDTPCKHCHMVVMKRPEDVRFDRLGHIDLAANTLCNLRCRFCGYAVHNSFSDAKYDPLAILRLFEPEDVLWDAAVDFNGGEPALLKDFDEYISYFTSRRIRVFLYTNGTVYRQSAYEGLKNGTIRWVCISLDAGTPSTYLKIKKHDYYARVLENIARYARAGSGDGGRVAVKYIFCEDNCGDDDICGFTYAMLAVRPQEVWLTFDFEPLSGLPGDCPDMGGYDYSRHVKAYAKTFVMLSKHGEVPVHFPEKHLAVVSTQGKELLRKAKEEIARLMPNESASDPDLLLGNFRCREQAKEPLPFGDIAVGPLRVRAPGESWRPLTLAGKKVVLAPACSVSRQLVMQGKLDGASVVAYLDRDTMLHGKRVDGIPILDYAELPRLAPDLVIVAAPAHNRLDIARSAAAQLKDPSHVCIYRNEGASR